MGLIFHLYNVKKQQMKKFIPLIIISIFCFNYTNIYSQAVCETPTENVIDLNEISIKKCDIKEEKTTTRNIIKTKVSRKRMNHRNRKIDKKNKLATSKKVLFTLVEEIPMFESCKKSTKSSNKKCFKRRINKHFSKNFHIEKFGDKIIKDKIFIQFSIDLYGKVINPQIISRNKDKLLHKELNEILYKLPNFTPGKEKGLPVIVTYSFPFNLTLN